MRNNMTIYAFTGEYGVGKTYAAKRLAKMLGVFHYAYADGIREELFEAFPGKFTRNELFDKPTPPEIRKLIQAWGEAAKAKNQLYWCDHLLKLAGSATSFTIGDIRFLHEYEHLTAVYPDVKLVYVGNGSVGYELYKLKQKADYFLKARSNTLEADLHRLITIRY